MASLRLVVTQLGSENGELRTAMQAALERIKVLEAQATQGSLVRVDAGAGGVEDTVNDGEISADEDDGDNEDDDPANKVDYAKFSHEELVKKVTSLTTTNDNLLQRIIASKKAPETIPEMAPETSSVLVQVFP